MGLVVSIFVCSCVSFMVVELVRLIDVFDKSIWLVLVLIILLVVLR